MFTIALEPASGPEEKEAWKPADKPTDKPNEVDVTLDVPARDAGSLHLAIHQFGDPNPATLSLTAYNEPAKLDAVHFHAGDKVATLSGTGLAQVRQVDLAGLTFTPLPDLTALAGSGSVQPDSFTLTDPKAPSPPAGEKSIALSSRLLIARCPASRSSSPVISISSPALGNPSALLRCVTVRLAMGREP